MYNDKITLSVAEAVKQVTGKKESAKDYTNRGGTGHDDFVDLHSIDKQKRRGSEPLTEKDIEEANEFTKAAAKAAIAGDKEFTFDGKTYPTEMNVDVAKKILGKNESTDLEEAKGFPESSQGAKMTYDAVVKLSASLKKGSNLNKAVNKRLGGNYDPEFRRMGKAIATIFDTLEEIDREYQGFDESTDLEEANNRLVAHTPVAAKRLIKKLKNKFSGYTWDQRIKGDEIIYPLEPHIVRFIKKQPEVADMNEEVSLEEASNADIKKVLATAKKLGASIKGNTADFGQGAVIDFSIEKGKVKFDGGMSSGVEYFNNVKDAISALMIGFDE